MGRWRWKLARWAGILLALNLLWRVVLYAIGAPIWGDEAFLAYNFMQRDLGEMWQALDYRQIAPPLWLSAEWIVSRLLGYSVYALRLLPFLFGLAPPLLLYQLARRLLSRHAAILALAVFAASYYPVRHSAEIKPYASDLFFALLLLLQTCRTRDNPDDGRSWILLSLLAAIAVWFSYPAAFVAGGCLLVLGLEALRERRNLVPLLTSGLILGLSFTAMYAAVGSVQEGATEFLKEWGHWGYTMMPLDRPADLPAWLWRVHTGRLFAYPNGGPHGGSTATFLLFLLGCFVLWRSRRRDTLGLLLAPFLLTLVAAAMHRYPYGGSARVAQHLVPSICLVVGAGLDWLARLLPTRYRARRAIGIFIVVAWVATIGSIVRNVIQPFKTIGDAEAKRVVELLAGETAAQDRWIVFGTLVPRPGRFCLTEGVSGESARFVYHVMRNGPAAMEWGIDPGSVEPGPQRTWLLLHTFDETFRREEWERYRAAMEARLGIAEVRRFELDEHETIVACVFPAR